MSFTSLFVSLELCGLSLLVRGDGEQGNDGQGERGDEERGDEEQGGGRDGDD